MLQDLINNGADFIREFINIILHMDLYLNLWIGQFGPGIYAILFLIVFCETGLVVTPFLPGDSLLFALGALTTVENAYIAYPAIVVTLITAGILGDATNYAIGKWAGPKVFASTSSRFFNKTHLVKTQKFYEKYGAKTIVLARFVPIIRTFAPFVAGMGQMKYSKFGFYNVAGAFAWVLIFVTAGRFFGNIPAVKTNFHIVIFGIIGVSVLPIVYEYVQAKRLRSADS